ncbi:alpha/beta hydrolase [Amycolatopsis japonica]|uniref:alpha/beta fold hydrolase n=1 Tax=Amycolatopsis japonica TaxID=208439 RepID=UPI00332C5590
MNGTELAYRRFGPRSEPPVVLLHGLASSGATWRSFALGLAAARLPVIAPDFRGHGASGHRNSYSFEDFELDVESLLEHLGVSLFDLVGHSLGGRIATMVAQRWPGRVGKLVLEETRPPPLAASMAIADPGIAFGRLSLEWGMVARWWSFDRRMIGSLARQFRTPDPDWWASLSFITASTLVVHGGAGSFVPFDRLQQAVSLIPDCRLVTIEAGHRVHSTRAAEFQAAVFPFLQR